MPASQMLSTPIPTGSISTGSNSTGSNSTERTTTHVDAQPRSQGEFIMSGNLTRLDGTVSEPVDSAAVMPDFMQREEVHTMIKKLRDSVSFWKRIQDSRVDSAWENAQSYALPQHHLFIK